MSVTMHTFESQKEWLAARSGRIGGSDAAAILGLNPYKDNVQLWEEKAGLRQQEDTSDKPYVKYGTQAEMHLRGLFRLDFPEYQIFYQEGNMWFNDRFPFAHASLDGWLVDQRGRKGILEIKTTNILQSMQKEKWKDRVPDNYYIQLLHYLMVTEFEFAVLKAQLKFDYGGDIVLNTRHYFIERSEVEADIKYLQNAETTFWRQLQTGHKPALILPDI